MKKIRNIVHISESRLTLKGGMGRIEYYWKEAFFKKDYNYIHIGPDEIGFVNHRTLYGYKALMYYKKLNITADLFLIHEPLAFYFSNLNIPFIIESHGIERRGYDILNHIESNTFKKYSLKGWIFSKVRIMQCDYGLKRADKLLLSNLEDQDYAIKHYKRHLNDILIFRNGAKNILITQTLDDNRPFTIIFNGSFIERKGIQVLISAIKIIKKDVFDFKVILIGTGLNEIEILRQWPINLCSHIEVYSEFNFEDEVNILSKGHVFVLPSYFEGQPLSLLQAMSSGLCCITTNCCGQKDIIINGFNGFLIEAGDSQMLADRLINLKNDPTTRIQIGLNASESMLDRTWSNCSDEVIKFIEQSIK